MENKFKRPISVWIAQITFVMFVLLLLLVAFSVACGSFPDGDISFVGMLSTVIVVLVIVVLLVAAFVGMATRSAYGRWLGIVMLTFIFVFANLVKIFFPDPEQPRVMAGIVQQVLLSVFLFVVILHISFSKKVARFFARRIDSR